MKAGTATLELLEREITRLQDRKTRAQEIDRDKIKSQLHADFIACFSKINHNKKLTDDDTAAARLLIYQTLDYSTRGKVNEILFPSMDTLPETEPAAMYALLSKLSHQQNAYLIRMALAGKSESKFPFTTSAFFLRRVAASAGMDITAIESIHQDKAISRQEKLMSRIEILKSKIDGIKKE